MNTYEVRKIISENYLTGEGIEIGAGMSPHPDIPGAIHHSFDIRTAQELAVLYDKPVEDIPATNPMEDIQKMFPNGADYLIAHHVLEHLSNPIKELITWFSYVKEGGYLVLSIPHVDISPDKGRPPVSIEHLFLDYTLNRNDASFESREHIYPFLMAWIDLGSNAGLDKLQVAERAHYHASLDKNDIHWHVFTGKIFKDFLILTSIISGRKLSILEFVCPENETADNILCTCQLDKDNLLPEEIENVESIIQNIKNKINEIK